MPIGRNKPDDATDTEIGVEATDDDGMGEVPTDMPPFQILGQGRLAASNWHDPEHQKLVIWLVDVTGERLAVTTIPAPLNKNPQSPMTIEIGIEHEDGCAKRIARYPLPIY